MTLMRVRLLKDIAAEIERDWRPVGRMARPYVNAMKQLQSLDDSIHIEPAARIVVSFLSVAGTWRGPVARRVKLELKAMLALHKNSSAIAIIEPQSN